MKTAEKLRCLFWVILFSPVTLAGFLWVKIQIAFEIGHDLSLGVNRAGISEEALAELIKRCARSKVEQSNGQ